MSSTYRPPWARSAPLHKGQISLSFVLLEMFLISMALGAGRGLVQCWEHPLSIFIWEILVASLSGAFGGLFNRLRLFAVVGTLLWLVPYFCFWALAMVWLGVYPPLLEYTMGISTGFPH